MLLAVTKMEKKSFLSLFWKESLFQGILKSGKTANYLLEMQNKNRPRFHSTLKHVSNMHSFKTKLLLKICCLSMSIIFFFFLIVASEGLYYSLHMFMLYNDNQLHHLHTYIFYITWKLPSEGPAGNLWYLLCKDDWYIDYRRWSKRCPP